MARFPRHSVPASLWRIPAGPVAEVSCRTIATAPAWMRGAILPCAPQATLQPNHTLPLFLAGVSESDTPCIPGKSSWGKNLARRGACGLASLRPNFFCRGEGGKETPRTRTRPARAPKRSAGHRCQRARKAPRFARLLACTAPAGAYCNTNKYHRIFEIATKIFPSFWPPAHRSTP